MKSNSILKFFSILLVAGILFTSCASSTLIQSYPSGAKVYIDGELTGVTPYWHSDTKITGSITNVDLVKEGYEPLYTSFSRTEQVSVGSIIGGLFIWPIFLWTMEYKPTHNYELTPLKYQSNVDSIQLSNPQSIEQQVPVQAVSPKIQRLKELKQLLDEKVITKEDFEKQKQKILDEK
ncbi:MAG: PEGA domain-containing protein [Paludibacter sp.]